MVFPLSDYYGNSEAISLSAVRLSHVPLVTPPAPLRFLVRFLALLDLQVYPRCQDIKLLNPELELGDAGFSHASRKLVF